MKISVITVCYNAREDIGKTIESVIAQTAADLEYIIIDGGSTDGTLELIRDYQKKFPITIVSEPDKGIYEAMNKGARLATGEWLNFMNAGDHFFKATVIADSLPSLDTAYDIVYGDTEVRYKDFKFIKQEPAPEHLWRGPVCHQSAFIKAAALKEHPYDTDSRLIADFKFFLDIYYNGGKLLKINRVVASFANDGISQREDSQVITDCYQAVRRWRKDPIASLYYKLIACKPRLKKILPRGIFRFLRTKIFN